MQPVQLFTADLCPFSHRTRLVLAEKGIEAQLIEVNLRDKPPEFLRIAPRGEVPVLHHAGRHLWESAVISEYLEEAFPEPSLLPANASARASARIWIQFADTQLYAHTRALIYARESAARQPALLQVARDLHFMEHEGLAKRAAGPYWLGADFSIADATIYPWFEQMVALERFRNFTWPVGCDRLLAWRDAVATRAAVRSQSQTDDYYLERYRAMGMGAPSDTESADGNPSAATHRSAQVGH
jgi:glutathione S-transferase